jgi:glycogen debranching enzyme
MGPITGTVWAWLIGPYVDPFGDQLATAGLGTVNEIFDGDDPTGAKGCIAQAWSVAEVLRAWDRLERLAVPAGGEGAK